MWNYIERFILPLINPIWQTMMKPIQWLSKLPTTIIAYAQGVSKKWLSEENASLRDYWRIGPYYIAKRFIALLILAVIAIVYFVFINPPYIVKQWLGDYVTIVAETKRALTASGFVEQRDPKDRYVMYRGQMKEGLYEGKGKRYDETGQVRYVGQWQAGKQNGTGTAYNRNGEKIYVGQWKDGLRDGKGTSYVAGQADYVGTWKAGKQDGKGTYYIEGRPYIKGIVAAGDVVSGQLYDDENVVRYDGSFKAYEGKQLPDGSGKQYRRDGTLEYDGQWQRGMFHGEGQLFNENEALIFKGLFRSGLKEGNGISIDDTGAKRFEGNYVAGRITGDGIRYRADGTKEYEGKWRYGVRHGVGIAYDANELPLYHGFWRDHRIAPEQFLLLNEGQVKAIVGDPSGEKLGVPNGWPKKLIYEPLKLAVTLEQSESIPDDTVVTKVELWRASVVDSFAKWYAKHEAKVDEAYQFDVRAEQLTVTLRCRCQHPLVQETEK